MKAQVLGIGVAGLNLNYTAGSCLFATGLSMTTVMMAGAYPAWIAYRTSQGTGRNLSLATHEGTIDCKLPFLYTETQKESVMAYLEDQIREREGLSAGPFSTEHVEEAGQNSLAFLSWLAPFDLGLSQTNRIEPVFDSDRNHFQLRLMSELRTGDRVTWERQVQPFVREIRKDPTWLEDGESRMNDPHQLEPFEDGFSRRTVWGALFVAAVMTPGSLYLGLVAGQTLGAAAEWVTLILFTEVARRSLVRLKRQEVFILFLCGLRALSATAFAHLALSGGPFAATIWGRYLIQAPQTEAVAEEIPDWVVPAGRLTRAVAERNSHTRIGGGPNRVVDFRR
ncbi:MAG: hypothetical protein H6752_18560 [Candidatus Omnitrophica bacterium]|nr:hypothetical protein [Candidatus Omnitrophota bacterium]